jgi:glycyl-tRNA synthetase alpha chain
MFDETYKFAEDLLKGGLILPALEHCLKCSHLFNLLDSSGSVGVTERMAYILRVRKLALAICAAYVDQGSGIGDRGSGTGDQGSGTGDRAAEGQK